MNDKQPQPLMPLANAIAHLQRGFKVSRRGWSRPAYLERRAPGEDEPAGQPAYFKVFPGENPPETLEEQTWTPTILDTDEHDWFVVKLDG